MSRLVLPGSSPSTVKTGKEIVLPTGEGVNESGVLAPLRQESPVDSGGKGKA